MRPYPFAFVCPSTQGISLALTRRLLLTTDLPVYATLQIGFSQGSRQKHPLTSERRRQFPSDLDPA
jgi:hypothetical protein